jgi:hypothetical protein
MWIRVPAVAQFLPWENGSFFDPSTLSMLAGVAVSLFVLFLWRFAERKRQANYALGLIGFGIALPFAITAYLTLVQIAPQFVGGDRLEMPLERSLVLPGIPIVIGSIVFGILSAGAWFGIWWQRGGNRWRSLPRKISLPHSGSGK